MSCFVYVLGCISAAGPRTYVGWTNDLEKRLAKHNSGAGAKSTRGRVWVMLYAERYETKQEAMSREWHLKRDATLRQQLRLCLGAKDETGNEK
jgi:putative endonuclease